MTDLQTFQKERVSLGRQMLDIYYNDRGRDIEIHHVYKAGTKQNRHISEQDREEIKGKILGGLE